MVHPGCGINGIGGSDSEGEQYRVSKMILDLPVGRLKLIIPTDGKYTNKGASGASKRSIWFFRTFLHISVWRNVYPFCAFATRYSRKGGGGQVIFFNNCLKLE